MERVSEFFTKCKSTSEFAEFMLRNEVLTNSTKLKFPKTLLTSISCRIFEKSNYFGSSVTEVSNLIPYFSILE